MKTKISALLTDGKTLLFDGAMGTYFASLPGRAELNCEDALLTERETIVKIHRAYLDAGARAIKLNTFTLPERLAAGREVMPLADAAVLAAQEAVQNRDAFIFADLGPLSTPQARPEVYLELSTRFLQKGIRCFLLETFTSIEGVAEYSAALKTIAPDAFILVSYAVGPDGRTRAGLSGEQQLLETAALETVDAVGVNCMSGPTHLQEFILPLLPKISKPVSVMPNAGYPTVIGRRMVFSGEPLYFAARMLRLRQAGVQILGGCCGTTPAHIEETAALTKRVLETETASKRIVRPAPDRQEEPNLLWEKLQSGKKVIAVEMDPPADDNVAPFLEGVRALKDAGVDAVTIADCPIGRPRADSSILSCKIRRELDVSPLPHLTCRDRNLNATKALLLGLSMEGVHNVLLVTGDPLPVESRNAVKAVFNFNSRRLAAFVKDLNESTFTTPFRIFGALNVNAVNFEMQLRIAQEKEDCGVSGFLTQPVLTKEAATNLQHAREVLKGKILGGIFPVISYRNACFLNNEVAGIKLDQTLIDRYAGKNRDEGEALAEEISLEIARTIAPFVDGFYLMTPFQRTELMGRIIRGIRDFQL